MRAKRTTVVVFTGLIGASAFVGCNSLVGLDQFSITGTQTGGSGGESTSTSTGGTAGTGGSTGGTMPDMDASDGDEPFVPECMTNADCTGRATTAAQDRYDEAGGPPDGSDAGRPTIVPAMCIQSIGKCRELLSPDCAITVGDYMDNNAVLLGTLFTTSGATGATNVQRQQSATLAFEEINTKGGLPPQKPNGPHRPIVVLSCNEANATRAATHMVEDLHIAALVGPNTSQDTITISQSISIKGGTVMMTPSAVASSIADLDDHDLTWLMAPSDVQRSPLMIQQINALETQLKGPPRNRTTVKLGIIYRDDALGQGTQTALLPLQINGKLATDNANKPYVNIDGYSPTAATLDTLVAKYAMFAPDIIALAGTAEAITKVMTPLEAAWTSDAGNDRPYYVTIDSAKVPELLTAAANADLRSRVRGTGITPTDQAKLVLAAFNVAYGNRYGSQPTASSTGPSYDAAYAIAYAIAAIKDLPVTGANIATGLRKLAGGSTTIQVGSTQVTAAFSKLSTPNDAGADSGVDRITAIGTFNPLEWDEKGAPVNALLEMWCIGAQGGVAYASSGLTYDLKTNKLGPNPYVQCP